jgi:hypothetical protein
LVQFAEKTPEGALFQMWFTFAIRRWFNMPIFFIVTGQADILQKEDLDTE